MDSYGVFDSDGSPVAFYNDDIHGPRQRPVYGERPEPTEDEPAPVAPIVGYEPNPDTLVPAEAVQITEAQWREFIDNPGRRRWINGAVVSYDPPGASPLLLVDAERDRRMLLPFTFLGKIYDADEKAQGRIEKARLSATAAVMAGAQAGDVEWPGVGMPFAWIAADNSQTPMDAQTMVAFGSAIAAREGMLIMAARAIKNRLLAGEVINDVTEDALWQFQT